MQTLEWESTLKGGFSITVSFVEVHDRKKIENDKHKKRFLIQLNLKIVSAHK